MTAWLPYWQFISECQAHAGANSSMTVLLLQSRPVYGQSKLHASKSCLTPAQDFQQAFATFYPFPDSMRAALQSHHAPYL